MKAPRLFFALPRECIAYLELIGDSDPLLAEWGALHDPVGSVLLEVRQWQKSEWDRAGLVAVSPAESDLVRHAALALEQARAGEASGNLVVLDVEVEVAVLLGLAVLAAIRASAGESGQEAALRLEERGWSSLRPAANSQPASPSGARGIG